jgi:PBP1b-binding outer membrane lipoprotein LpoB
MKVRRSLMSAMLIMTALVFGSVAMASQAKLHSITGEVTKMDASQKTMTVKGSAGKREKEISFQIAPDAKILRNGQKTDLTALKVGDRVVVRYASGKGLRTAHSITLEMKNVKSSANY